MLAAGVSGPCVEPLPFATEIDGHDRSRQRVADARPLVVMPARLEGHKMSLPPCRPPTTVARGSRFRARLARRRRRGQELVLDAVRAIQWEGHPIERLGWVSDEVMWQTLTDAAFVVFISLHEGYGLPLVEALSCGVPC